MINVAIFRNKETKTDYINQKYVIFYVSYINGLEKILPIKKNTHNSIPGICYQKISTYNIISILQRNKILVYANGFIF